MSCASGVRGKGTHSVKDGLSSSAKLKEKTFFPEAPLFPVGVVYS